VGANIGLRCTFHVHFIYRWRAVDPTTECALVEETLCHLATVVAHAVSLATLIYSESPRMYPSRLGSRHHFARGQRQSRAKFCLVLDTACGGAAQVHTTAQPSQAHPAHALHQPSELNLLLRSHSKVGVSTVYAGVLWSNLMAIYQQVLLGLCKMKAAESPM
jgi:hypothetical protein